MIDYLLDRVYDYTEVPNNNNEDEPYKPTTFQEAWWHPDPKYQKLWHAAIHKEF